MDRNVENFEKRTSEFAGERGKLGQEEKEREREKGVQKTDIIRVKIKERELERSEWEN